MTTAASSVDVAVVGGGLIGSAAARHLAEAGHDVAVFAPPEPQDWSSHTGPFASHYDAGRITRVMASDEVWAEVAARSIGRYDDIAKRSGIEFHDPRGLAWVGPDLGAAVTNAVARGADARLVSPEWLLATTGIRPPNIAGLQCGYETAPAGVVNPRQLVAAQLRLCELAAGAVIPAAVSSVRSTATGVELTGGFGTVRAGKVLVAAGAYGADLLGIDVGLDRHLRTTLRVDMGPGHEIPSLICELVEHPDIDNMYWNPPVRYPDGRMLFKIGCETDAAPRARSVGDLTKWFQGTGDPAEAAALLATTKALLPAAAVRSWDTVPCVVTRTASELPAIGWVEDRVAVALAGNGSSAKSSDELGRLASSLFSETGWVDDQLPSTTFAVALA